MLILRAARLGFVAALAGARSGSGGWLEGVACDVFVSGICRGCIVAVSIGGGMFCVNEANAVVVVVGGCAGLRDGGR